MRSLPTTASVRQGVLPRGRVIPLVCKVTGTVVHRDNDENGAVSNLWYRLPGDSHAWVSTLYVANVDETPPYCGTGKRYRGRVTSRMLVPYEAPTTGVNSHGALTRGSQVTINCQLQGQAVGGNRLWYNLPLGLWVPARHVSTPGASPAFCTR